MAARDGLLDYQHVGFNPIRLANRCKADERISRRGSRRTGAGEVTIQGGKVIEETTGTISNLTSIEVECDGQYNQAIDDACHALEVTGQDEAWCIVRSLREPKVSR